MENKNTWTPHPNPDAAPRCTCCVGYGPAINSKPAGRFLGPIIGNGYPRHYCPETLAPKFDPDKTAAESEALAAELFDETPAAPAPPARKFADVVASLVAQLEEAKWRSSWAVRYQAQAEAQLLDIATTLRTRPRKAGAQ